MADRGIEFLYYHQVDNPAAIVCDPAFIGLHALHGSEMSTKVVAKTSAAERMGAVVFIEDGRTEIIEYSDLPPERAAATRPDGELLLWAGNTAMHVLDQILERLVVEGCRLPLHQAQVGTAHRRVGRAGDASHPNTYKFEQFIFDAHAEWRWGAGGGSGSRTRVSAGEEQRRRGLAGDSAGRIVEVVPRMADQGWPRFRRRRMLKSASLRRGCRRNWRRNCRRERGSTGIGWWTKLRVIGRRLSVRACEAV